MTDDEILSEESEIAKGMEVTVAIAKQQSLDHNQALFASIVRQIAILRVSMRELQRERLHVAKATTYCGDPTLETRDCREVAGTHLAAFGEDDAARLLLRAADEIDYVRSVIAELDCLRAERDRLRLALSVDLGRANRDAMYRHDLKALVADGAKGGCHTDVGTAVRKQLNELRAELADAKQALADERHR